jgi:Flp pilus assembly protein TadB
VTRLAIAVAACLALLGAAYAVGLWQGTAALQARLDAEMVASQQAAAETTRALAVAEQQRARLARELEDAANAEPVSSAACLPLSRVRRLAIR